MSSNKVLEISIDLSLKISPSCHTSSKAFDISKKNIMRFKCGVCIKGCIYIMDSCQQLIYTRIISLELLAWRPDWWVDSKLCSSRYSKRELNISLSNIFPQIGSRETGTGKPRHVLVPFDRYWHPKKICPNNISSTFLRSSFSTFSTF